MIRYVSREANLILDRIVNIVFIDLVGVNVLYLLEALENDKTSGIFNFVSVV